MADLSPPPALSRTVRRWGRGLRCGEADQPRPAGWPPDRPDCFPVKGKPSVPRSLSFPTGLILALCIALTAWPDAVSAVGGAPLVHLPADQAAHANARNEWWYVVGHLRSGGRTFGYE